MAPRRDYRIPNIIKHPNGSVTMGIRSLRSLCLDSIIVNSQGKLFIKGLPQLVKIGLVPDKLSIMMVNKEKFHLQFWLPSVDMHPFTVIFRNLFSLFNGIGYLRPWKVKHIEVLNITFEKDDLSNILRAFRKLRPISLTLLNCAYDVLTELERTRLAVGLTDGGRIQVIYIGRTSAVKQPLPGAITAKYDDKSLRVISEDEGEDEEDEDENGEVNIGETDDSGDEEMMCIVEDCQDDHGRAADAARKLALAAKSRPKLQPQPPRRIKRISSEPPHTDTDASSGLRRSKRLRLPTFKK